MQLITNHRFPITLEQLRRWVYESFEESDITHFGIVELTAPPINFGSAVAGCFYAGVSIEVVGGGNGFYVVEAIEGDSGAGLKTVAIEAEADTFECPAVEIWEDLEQPPRRNDSEDD